MPCSAVTVLQLKVKKHIFIQVHSQKNMFLSDTNKSAVFIAWT